MERKLLNGIDIFLQEFGSITLKEIADFSFINNYFQYFLESDEMKFQGWIETDSTNAEIKK